MADVVPQSAEAWVEDLTKGVDLTQVNADLNFAADSVDGVRKSAMLLMGSLQRAYGMDGMLRFPEPDSKIGNNADQYTVPGTNKDGKQTTKTGSHIKDFVRRSALGIEVAQRLNWIQDGKNKVEGTPEPYLTMGPVERDEEAEYWQGRLTSGFKAMRDALKLHYKIIAINELNPTQVQVAYATDSKGNLKSTTLPLVVQHPTDRLKFEPYTVSQFLLLDTAKASKVGPFDANGKPTFDAVIGTIGRQKKQKGGAAAMKQIKPLNMDELEIAMIRIAFTLSNATDDGRKMYANVLRRLNAPDASAFRLTVGDTALVFDAIYKDIEQDYLKDSSARQKAHAAGRVA